MSRPVNSGYASLLANANNAANEEAKPVAEQKVFTDADFKVKPIKDVSIDGLALLKIVKHCNDHLPSMVSGSLLGVDVNGTVEISYAYPYPQHASKIQKNKDDEIINEDDYDDQLYQIEMMKMLGQMNYDNNVVGWYQSSYCGAICTNDVILQQQQYQTSEDLAGNTVVLIYDPHQTKKGGLCIKAFRLSDKFLALLGGKSAANVEPKEIFEELPIKITNQGHCAAYITCLQDNHKDDIDDCTFENLSLSSSDNQIEKQLEELARWIKDYLIQEQIDEVQPYVRQVGKLRQDYVKAAAKRRNENQQRRENDDTLLSTKIEDLGLKALPEAPSKIDSLLAIEQIDRYTQQINEQVESCFTKLTVSSKLNEY